MRYLGGGGVHSGHNQSTHYSSKGEDKRMYTFRIPILQPSWISHFNQAIYYITLQKKIWYNIICISASSVPMNYFYLLELFFGDLKKYVCGLFEIYGISQWIFLLGSCLEINNQSYNNIHTTLERPFNYLLNVIELLMIRQSTLM